LDFFPRVSQAFTYFDSNIYVVAEAKFSGNSLLYNYICMTNCVIIS